MSIFEREALLVGDDGVRKLSEKTVAVFGLGGVGSFVCEALARGGIGHLILVDNDTVAESNLNRQLVALHSTLGKKKTEVAKARVLDINPAAKVETYEMFYMPDTALDGLNSEFLSWWPDYYKLSGEAGEIPTTLGRFGLMNGTEHFGFFTYEG